MRVILAGGSGLIGRQLIAELSNGNYEIIVLSRDPQQVRGLPEGVQVIGWDGKTTPGWGELVDGAFGVINLAGENIAGEGFFPARWTEERKQQIIQSRVNAGKAILEAIQAARVKPEVLVQASAIGFYGALGAEPVEENSSPGGDTMAHICIAWEQSTLAVETMGVRRVVIRTGVVFSRRGGALARLILPFKLFVGGPLGSGKQYLSWIHIDDEVGAIRFLMENKQANGVFNLTAPTPVNNAEFATIAGQVMKRPAFLPVPSFVFRLMFGEVATVVVDGQRVIPKRLSGLGFEFKYPQLKEALADLL